MLGAPLGLGSFSLMRLGSWHTGIGGAALLRTIGRGPRERGWLRPRAVDRARVGFGGRARVDATLERPTRPCWGMPHLEAGS
jgi:hypothetical protein